MRRPLPFFMAVLLGVLGDLLSKKIAFDWLTAGSGHALIPNVLQLSLARNEGAAFSILKAHPSLLLLVTGVMLGLLAWYYARIWRTAHWMLLLALGLLLVGATGNLYDRLRFKYVRDFIDFMPELPLIGHWAVFNVADICITVGVLLYAAHALFFDKAESAEPASASAVVKQ